MQTANWGVADWANNPEMPPTRWETLEVIPQEERESCPAMSARLARHARAQDEALYRDTIARRWPRANWGIA